MKKNRSSTATLVAIGFAMTVVSIASGKSSPSLNGAQGKAYTVDAVTRQFEILTRTAYDLQTKEGRSLCRLPHRTHPDPRPQKKG